MQLSKMVLYLSHAYLRCPGVKRASFPSALSSINNMVASSPPSLSIFLLPPDDPPAAAPPPDENLLEDDEDDDDDAAKAIKVSTEASGSTSTTS